MMRAMMKPAAGVLAAAWFSLWPMTTAQAQYATLVADSVRMDGQDKVRADGNVEVYYEGQRVLADGLVYDQKAETLELFGPITLIDATGQVITASYAALSADLKNGIMRSARMVLEEQMQIAAAEIDRVDGRYTQLYKTVASSCNVCGQDVPLWQIRAERVVHDQEERQLYFDHARFEVMGLPIFWVPQMRLPDPTLKRSTGFLIPSLQHTSALGLGFRFPYFVTLGESADVTLTPFIAANSRTLEGRYRQAFRWGRVEFEGAVSADDLLADETRAYVFGKGEFWLPGDFTLNLNVELVSDNAYLSTYDYSDKDRLSNGVEITRTERNEYISASVESLRTLRDSEVPIEDTLATALIRATYARRFPHMMGGEGRLLLDLQGYERKADDVDADLLNACSNASPVIPASECLARDVLRATAEAGWFRDWTFYNGMIARAEGQVAADLYLVGQDSSLDPRLTRVTPAAAVELRWPMARGSANGARDVLEPVAQLAWSRSYGDDTPNEDSRLVEFDEGNLLSLSHFPGKDARETGLRGTLGLSWTHYMPTGREYAMTFGRVFQQDGDDPFSGASGLSGATSDWLVAGRIDLADRLSLSNRSLFDDELDFTKSETRLSYTGEKITAASSYIWVDAATYEGRSLDVSEWTVDFGYDFARNWTGTLDWRYDLVTNSAAEAGVGLRYQNECVNIDLSLSRRFTSSTSLEPSTDVGLTISLNGFGQDGRPYARGCSYVKG